MERYIARILSKYLHQEGFLEIKLQELIDEGLAVDGFVNSNNLYTKSLMNIFYDQNRNPYIIFRLQDEKQAEMELSKKLIFSMDKLEFVDFPTFAKSIEDGFFHKEIQKKDPKSLI